MRFVILGGGPAGYAAAQAASALGADVTLVEDQGLGGNCNLTDAIPSKTLIATANVMAEIERAETLGVDFEHAPAEGRPAAHRRARPLGRRAPVPRHPRPPGGDDDAHHRRAGPRLGGRHRARQGRRPRARRAVRRAAGRDRREPLGAAVLQRRPRPRLHHPRGARPARAAAAPAGGRRRRDGLRVRGVLRLLRLARDAALGPLADPAGRGPRRRRDRPGGVPGPRHRPAVRRARQPRRAHGRWRPGHHRRRPRLRRQPRDHLHGPARQHRRARAGHDRRGAGRPRRHRRRRPPVLDGRATCTRPATSRAG